MTAWRHRLRRTRFAAISLVAGIVIAAAVTMALLQLLLPLVSHNPNFIARQLSERLHRPVTFAAVAGEWQLTGPLLTVRDLTLGADQPGGASVTFPHAAVKFNLGALLRPGSRWITLRLRDVRLRLEHTGSGWRVAGFSSAPGGQHSSLESLPVNLDLTNLGVDLVDEVGRHAWSLFAPHLRVVNSGGRVLFGGSVRQSGTSQGLAISGYADIGKRDYTLHVVTADLDLANASRGVDLHGYGVRSGHADLEAWGTWRAGRLASASVEYSLRGVTASGPGGRELELPAWSGALRAHRVSGGWDLAWRGPGDRGSDIDQAGGVLLQLRGAPGKWRVSAAAQSVDVSPWLRLLAMAPQAPQAWVDWVGDAQPHMELDNAALVWRQTGRFSASARFSDLHSAATDTAPGLALATGVVRADEHGVSLELPAQPASLALTGVFRDPFRLARLSGTLVAWRGKGHWNVATDALRFTDADGLAASARVHLTWFGAGRSPFLSAYAVLEHAKVPDARRFLPYHRMSHKLVGWLDHALVGGEVASGRVLMRGTLADWPYLDHSGRFEAAGIVRDATFDFSDQWPQATGVDAAFDFIDNRMGIVATHARVRDVTATHAVATLGDLGHGTLDLEVQGSGRGPQLLDFVRHSPVGQHALDALEGITVGGTAKFGIDLSIPLHDVRGFSLQGKVDLAHADVTAEKWNVALGDLGGAFLVDGKGFRAPALAGTFRGAPAILSMAVGENNVRDPADILEASLATRASVQTLAQDYPGIAQLVAPASGTAAFQVGVRVEAGTDGGAPTPILDIRSNLVGLALDFPAPLDKPAATPLPLDLTLRLPLDGAPLAVSLGDVLRVRGRLADPGTGRPAALAIQFGGTVPAAVPATGLVVDGKPGRLDISGWIQRTLQGASGAAFPQLVRADVATAHAEVFGTDLGALDFKYRTTDKAATISVDGAAMKGTVTLPTVDLMTTGIHAQLQYLRWPGMASVAKAAQAPPPPQPPSTRSPIAPTAIPPLHVSLDELQLGDTHLGATRFESVPTATGMHVVEFSSRAADFSVDASGDWVGSMAQSRSRFSVALDSHDFGKALQAFGFGGVLAGGEDAQVHIEGSWPGPPSSFSLEQMAGKLSIKMGQGRILAVKPGFGRLLGLLSVRELPQRLMLRFGDVFKSGFGFDRASATFTLGGGDAYTDDMVIDAPAAQIRMHGRAGLQAHDFDLTVDVTPHLGGTLPVVGAVIGGPVGAAAGLVVQGLVGSGLNKAAGSEYRVTGSWEDPKIVSADETSPLAPAAASSAGLAPPVAVPAPTSSAGAPLSPAAPAVSTSPAAPATSAELLDDAAIVPALPRASSSAGLRY